MNIYIVTLSVPNVGTISVSVGASNHSAAIMAAIAQYPGATAQTVKKVSGL